MRKRVNTLTQSVESVVNKKGRPIQIPEASFRQGFTPVFGFYRLNLRSRREIRAGDISPGESVEFVVNDFLYDCRGSSTNRPCFFQNKANLPAGQNEGKLSYDKGL